MEQIQRNRKRSTLAPPNNLKAYREAALLQQGDLADAIHRKSQTISNIERRRAVPRYATMRDITAAINAANEKLNLKQIAIQDIFPYTRLQSNLLIDDASENFSSVA